MSPSCWSSTGFASGFYKRVSTITKRDNQDLDTDINSSFMAGLDDKKRLEDTKIIGALFNPLYQSRGRMVEGGLCTEEQYDNGRVELLDRLTHYYEGITEDVGPAVQNDSINEWDDLGLLDSTKASKSPDQMAEAEYNQYCVYMKSSYLPTMKPSKVLGAYTLDGDPKEEPVYSIGAVIKKGRDLPGGHNHAEYVDETGHYDVVRFLEHHKDTFPAIYTVCVGQICPHISTEVDCESLFSQAGFLADPRRSLTSVRLYERLVMTKHRLGRIYCHLPAVKELYLKRWREKDWDEREERDAKEFLELEKAIHLETFPHDKQFFEDEEDEEEGGEKKAAETNKVVIKRKRSGVEKKNN